VSDRAVTEWIERTAGGAVVEIVQVAGGGRSGFAVDVAIEDVVRPFFLQRGGRGGVGSFMGAERQREIGIRVAIGATRGNIVSLVTRQGLSIVSIGLAIGLAGALGLARLLGSLLFGVRPTDPTTVAAVTTTIAIVAALACGLPAWRGTTVAWLQVTRLGVSDFTSVRIGKRFELTVEGEIGEDVLAKAREIADEILSNSVIEDVVGIEVVE